VSVIVFFYLIYLAFNNNKTPKLIVSIHNSVKPYIDLLIKNVSIPSLKAASDNSFEELFKKTYLT
jgi:hypothetical protein